MSKVKTVYVCTECGAVSPKWSGQCGECGQWNCLVEQVEAKKAPQNARFAGYAGESTSCKS